MQTGEGSFLPCELSLCQFSLSGGCSRLYHAYVRPPPEAIPLGSAYNIMTTARDTHRLDLDSEPMTTTSASDHASTVRGILSFLGDGDDGYLPPIYTAKVNNNEQKVCFGHRLHIVFFFLRTE